MVRIYRGYRDESGAARVTVNGATLPPRHDLRNHSPDGFEWGYSGSGPAQLALAIVADHAAHAPDDLVLLRRIAGLPDVCATCDGTRKELPGIHRRCAACAEKGSPGHVETLILQAYQGVKAKLIALLPHDAMEWTFGTPMVSAVLRSLAEERRKELSRVT